MGPGFTLRGQARRTRPAVSGSLSYGLIVHLLALPTPPHGDAVPGGYRPKNACLEWTFTTLIVYACRRTHAPSWLAMTGATSQHSGLVL
jgi:hypothetical protein